MEYLEGVSVHDLVEQRGHLTVPDACEIVRQAARGLQFIHRNEMVHRDIKPSNLMVTIIDGDGVSSQPLIEEHAEPVEGVVKILDLGLALLAGDAQDRLTRFDNKAMGTGMYMSPEQWKTTSVDIRADIYSLGCTLYHLLAGKPPFVDSDLRPEKGTREIQDTSHSHEQCAEQAVGHHRKDGRQAARGSLCHSGRGRGGVNPIL